MESYHKEILEKQISKLLEKERRSIKKEIEN